MRNEAEDDDTRSDRMTWTTSNSENPKLRQLGFQSPASSSAMQYQVPCLAAVHVYSAAHHTDDSADRGPGQLIHPLIRKSTTDRADTRPEVIAA